MNQFIIVTHATLAGGFADVVRFFKSDLENVQFINAYVESQEFEKEFRTALEKVKGENVIVLSDIMGGSVNQVATRLMQEFSYQLSMILSGRKKRAVKRNCNEINKIKSRRECV